MTEERLNKMHRLYTSVIPGVMDSGELSDMRDLIAEVRELKGKIVSAEEVLNEIFLELGSKGPAIVAIRELKDKVRRLQEGRFQDAIRIAALNELVDKQLAKENQALRELLREVKALCVSADGAFRKNWAMDFGKFLLMAERIGAVLGEK